MGGRDCRGGKKGKKEGELQAEGWHGHVPAMWQNIHTGPRVLSLVFRVLS